MTMLFLNMWRILIFGTAKCSNKVLGNLNKKYFNLHFDSMNVCAPCHLAKQCKLPFPLNKSSSEHAFDLIHVDILGPFNITFLHGHKYFLTVVDDYSRYI